MTGAGFHERGESVRRVVTTVLAWSSWLGMVGLFLWATLNYDPAKGHFAPQWVSFAFITCIGVGIAASSALSRYRLSDTILAAFTTGMLAQAEQAAELKAKMDQRNTQE